MDVSECVLNKHGLHFRWYTVVVVVYGIEGWFVNCQVKHPDTGITYLRNSFSRSTATLLPAKLLFLMTSSQKKEKGICLKPHESQGKEYI